MRKILLGIVILLTATACEFEDNNGNIVKIEGISYTIEIARYNGHEYVVFDGTYGLSAVHNPDCPCMLSDSCNVNNCENGIY